MEHILTDAEDLINELKEKNPDMYAKMEQNIEKRAKKFYRGCAREGAGRKKEYINKVKETYSLEQEDVNLLKTFAKQNNISKNKALSIAIKQLKIQQIT